MTVLDFVLLGFLAVTVIIGLKKGFAKMIGNSICIVLALGGSVVAAIVLTTLVQQTNLFLNLRGVASGWFSQSFMTTQITSADQLAELLVSGEVGVFSVLSGISGQIYSGMQTCGAESLGTYIGSLIATAIVAFVVWLVAYLLLKYALLGIKKLVCKIATLPVIKSIDKIIGAIFSVAIGYVLVFGVLYSAFGIVCAKFLPDFGQKVIAMVDGSMLFSYVHHTNFIGNLICEMFQVNYSTFAPLA